MRIEVSRTDMDKTNNRTCAVCGKVITSGYVWDSTDTFCSDECAASVFDGDEGCVDILIDDGRMVWQDKF